MRYLTDATLIFALLASLIGLSGAGYVLMQSAHADTTLAQVVEIGQANSILLVSILGVNLIILVLLIWLIRTRK